MQSVVDEVLFGARDAWLCFVDGLLTTVELRNLLLAHLESLVGTTFAAGVPGARIDALEAAFDDLLFSTDGEGDSRRRAQHAVAADEVAPASPPRPRG
jgi:hypothetical protein